MNLDAMNYDDLLDFCNLTYRLDKNGPPRENREARFLIEASFPVVEVVGCQFVPGGESVRSPDLPPVPECLLRRGCSIPNSLFREGQSDGIGKPVKLDPPAVSAQRSDAKRDGLAGQRVARYIGRVGDRSGKFTLAKPGTPTAFSRLF